MRRGLPLLLVLVAGLALAGDFTGPQNATQLRGKKISTTAPTNGQVLQYVSATSTWTPATAGAGLSNPVTRAQGGLATDTSGMTGLVALTGAATTSARTIAGGTGITVSNGDGVAGNPTLSIASGAIGLSTRTIGVAVTAIAGGATNYLTYSTGSATDVPLTVMTEAATARRLYCLAVTAPGVGETETFTVRKSTDGGVTFADTTLTCVISGTSHGCNDTSHTAALSAGDTLGFKAVQSAGSVAANVRCTVADTN